MTDAVSTQPTVGAGRRRHTPRTCRWTGENYTTGMTNSETVTTEPDLGTVLGLFEDEYARAILAATSDEPMTVGELTDRIDAAPATLYRRVERLVDAGFLEEGTRVRSDGHHESTYEATVVGLHVTLEGGSYEFEIERDTEDPADTLHRLWSEF